MSKTYFKVQTQFCGECSLALRRFIGGMEGVNAVDVERGMVSVDFDDTAVAEEHIRRIAQDSIERLGYSVNEE